MGSPQSIGRRGVAGIPAIALAALATLIVVAGGIWWLDSPGISPSASCRVGNGRQASATCCAYNCRGSICRSCQAGSGTSAAHVDCRAAVHES